MAAPAHDLGLSNFVESCLGRRLTFEHTHTHTHTHTQDAIEISTLSTSHAAFRMMTSGEFDSLTPYTRFTRNERHSPCRPLKDLQGVKKQPASPRTLQVEKR